MHELLIRRRIGILPRKQRGLYHDGGMRRDAETPRWCCIMRE
jgi:hypothetical protein